MNKKHVYNITLKVIRYKNYGCTITGPQGSRVDEHRFYWSFYELNNGEIIVLHITEYLTNGKATSNDYDFSYAKSELKSGEIIEYKFGNGKPNTKEISDEFFDWFDSNPPVRDLKNNFAPYEDEEKCVKEFFDKNILKTKELQTNIVNV